MIVVTGAGAVAPNGLGVDAYWKAVVDGRSGLGRLSRFDVSRYPVTVGGEVSDFDLRAHVPSRLRPQTDRSTQFALAAAAWALEDAGIDPAELGAYDAGVITANGCGGFEFGQHELQKLWSEGPHRVSAYQSFAWFYAVNTGQISIRHGLRGHGSVVVTEQAGGLDALGAACRQLRGGTLRVALTGGVDAPLSPWGLTAQIPNGLLSEESDPDRCYLPFDRAASGYVPGEGGAFLVLEEASAARERGVRAPYGEIAGYAATFDPAPGSGRPPALARAIGNALFEAGLGPRDIGVVVADAQGTPELDALEAAAITEVFGPKGVPVAVPKATTGRLYSGGAPLDVLAALLMIREGVIPAAANVTDVPEEYDVDVVAGAGRTLPIRAALIVARGAGGFNSALVVRGSSM
ncbi:ketosynthase chain-length factor [Streptomyces sp. NPDC005760]|uniref:ketosynthase chain-length factor n=1 Tax=Streptomyces sp. NPDC005760 TaxID=3156718 RepID=UPI0033E7E66C